MTASLFVTGTRVGSIGSDPRGADPRGADPRGADPRDADSRDAGLRGVDARSGRPEDVAHAVAKPVVDGLEASVCGQLVRATAAEDWPSAGHAERCEECARIAG